MNQWTSCSKLIKTLNALSYNLLSSGKILFMLATNMQGRRENINFGKHRVVKS